METMPQDHAPRSSSARTSGRTPRRTVGRARPARRASLALVMAVALAAAACSGSDQSSEGDWGVAPGYPEPAPAPGMPGGMPDFAPPAFEDGTDGRGGVGGGVGGVGGERPDDGRAVVRDASIELVVDDGASAIDAAEAQAVALGGSVASATRTRDEEGVVFGYLVLRVPSDRLVELVDALDALARSVPQRNIEELDVTMQLSDIDAQLRNLRAFEDELRELLTEVRRREGSVDGLVTVSETLRQVRTEIDMIEGRRVQLADRVALSTVRVTIRQARSTTPVIGTWDLPSVVRDALATTVRLGQLAVESVVWLALTVLPALVLALVVLAIMRTAIRRRRATKDRPGARTGAGTGTRAGDLPGADG